MIYIQDIELGDIVDIKHIKFQGTHKVVKIYQRFTMDYVDLEDSSGHIEDFSLSFLNSYGCTISKPPKYTVTQESPNTVKYCFHSWKEEMWFTSRLFVYCKHCGKSKEEDKPLKRDYF